MYAIRTYFDGEKYLLYDSKGLVTFPDKKSAKKFLLTMPISKEEKKRCYIIKYTEDEINEKFPEEKF